MNVALHRPRYKEIAGCLGKKLRRQTRVIPTESFRNQSPAYSAWRTQGMRTHISTSFFFFHVSLAFYFSAKMPQNKPKGLWITKESCAYRCIRTLHTPSPWQTVDQPHHLPFVSLVGKWEAGRRRCSVWLSNPLSSFRIKTGIKRNVKQRNLNILNLFSGYRQPIISFSLGFCP